MLGSSSPAQVDLSDLEAVIRLMDRLRTRGTAIGVVRSVNAVMGDFLADAHGIPPDIRGDLASRKIPVVDGRIIEIAHHGGHNATVKLDTGRNVAVDILFAHPRSKQSASLHESLGLATVDTPLGIAIKVDERRETSMPGIYAAGDLASPSCPRSPRHHRRARWRVSSPSNRCWFESTGSLL